jgi:hypothetical protein
MKVREPIRGAVNDMFVASCGEKYLTYREVTFGWVL